MATIKAKVLKTKIENGKMFAIIQCNGKLPPVGKLVDVRFGAKRSLMQNNFLWAYYTFLIESCGLKDHGFFCPEALHESLKAHFLSEKKMDKGEWKIIEDGSTATLNKVEFSEYMEKVDQFVQEFFGVNTHDFWEQYKKDFQ